MSTLTIEGIPRPVEVDDAFRDLSPEQQAATVDHIRAAWDAQQRQGGAASTTPSEPTGFGLGAIREGARNAARGFGATARVLGDAIGSDTLRDAGRSLDEAIPADPNYRPSTPEVMEGIRGLDAGRVLRNLPGAIAETLPGMGATLAAGAAGTAVGGPVGGFLAAGAAGAGQQFGQVAEQRAQNDGRQTPNAADLAIAGGTALASGALDAVGLRGAGGAAARSGSATLAAPRGFAAHVAEAGRHVAREGVTEAAQDVVEQAGSTAGTERGLTIDPAQAATGGVLGAGARAVTSVPGAVARGAAESVVDLAANRAAGNMSPEEAASVERVNRAVDQRAAETRARSGREVPVDELVNSVREELQNDVATQMRQARAEGWIDADEHRGLQSVFETAIRHNKELAEGRGREEGDGLATGLARLDDLPNAPPVFREGMRNLFRDLNTLAAASRKKNLTGPFERLGDLAGRAAAVGLSATGGPAGAVAGIASMIGSNPLAARVGGAIGRQVDILAGARMPGVVLARKKALATLRRAGIEDPGDSWAIASEVNRVLTDERLATRAALGLKTDTETMARLAEERARTVARQELGMAAATEAAEVRGARARRRAQDRLRSETEEEVAADAAQPLAMADATDAAEAAGRQARGRAEDRVAQATARDVAADAARRVRLSRRAAERVASASEAPSTPSGSGTAGEAAGGSDTRVPGAVPEAVEGAQPAAPPAGAADFVDLASERPAGASRGPLFGWQRYVQRAVQSKGRNATRDEMRQAVHKLGERGDLMPDEVTAILSKDAPHLPRRLLGGIIATIADKQGWSFEDAPDVQLVAPAGDNPTIHSPTRYAAATESYRRAVERASERANDAGDHELVELVETFGTRTLSDLPMNARRLRAEALISAAPDAVSKARRRAALNPLLREESENRDSPNG